MLRIKIYRNTPGKAWTGYAQILKAWQQEVVHHFIFTGFRLDKFRMLINILNETVCIFA